jgi:hypothetical protein
MSHKFALFKHPQKAPKIPKISRLPNNNPAHKKGPKYDQK